MGKRAFDFLLASFGLLMISPLVLVVSVLIKWDSRGPVFYLQERIGRNSIPFKVFKFRTMHINADKHTAITVGMRDPRITAVGYYLRKFKIDELPQLINVLAGSMSLVGPRPELKKFVDVYTEQQRRVLSVKPGITDMASIQFRNENELLEGKEDPIAFYIKEIMPVKLKLNLEYVSEQSFWRDIKIIALTVMYIFKKD